MSDRFSKTGEEIVDLCTTPMCPSDENNTWPPIQVVKLQMSWKPFVIAGGVFISTIAATLIVIRQTMYISNDSTSQQPNLLVHKIQQDLNFSISQRLDCAHLTTKDDLYRISNDCSCVEVECALPTDDPNFKGFPPSVNILTINAPLSERSVELLINTSKSLTKLVLDMDKLCTSSREISVETLPVLSLPRLETILIRNDSLCELSAWIYTWKLPSLKELLFDRVDFRLSSFRKLNGFLRKSKDMLDLVDFKDCKLCSSCEEDTLQAHHFVKGRCGRTAPLSP